MSTTLRDLVTCCTEEGKKKILHYFFNEDSKSYECTTCFQLFKSGTSDFELFTHIDRHNDESYSYCSFTCYVMPRCTSLIVSFENHSEGHRFFKNQHDFVKFLIKKFSV